MGDALLTFIVAGDIPGTHTQMGYKTSIVFAVVVVGITLLRIITNQRKRIATLMRLYQSVSPIELITL